MSSRKENRELALFLLQGNVYHVVFFMFGDEFYFCFFLIFINLYYSALTLHAGSSNPFGHSCAFAYAHTFSAHD